MAQDLKKHSEFLSQLDDALDDALNRYGSMDDSALAELHKIKKELLVAQKAMAILEGQPVQKPSPCCDNKLSGLITRKDHADAGSAAVEHRIMPA
mgnify:CR=1 FL=1